MEFLLQSWEQVFGVPSLANVLLPYVINELPLLTGAGSERRRSAGRSQRGGLQVLPSWDQDTRQAPESTGGQANSSRVWKPSVSVVSGGSLFPSVMGSFSPSPFSQRCKHMNGCPFMSPACKRWAPELSLFIASSPSSYQAVCKKKGSKLSN